MKTNKNEKQTRSVLEDRQHEYEELVEYVRNNDSPAFKEYLEAITSYQYQVEEEKTI